MSEHSNQTRVGSQRTSEFAENAKLNELIGELAAALGPVDSELRSGFTRPSLPPLFLLGNPRSGTTLLMSVLMHTDSFAVPTNLLSRFSYAPYLGAKLQQLLFNPDYDFRSQMAPPRQDPAYDSMLGTTQGAMGANEFYHFWRQFFPNRDVEKLDNKALESVDIAGLLQGIAAIESVLERPFAAKAMMIQYNLDYFAAKFPPALYVYLRRQPDRVMGSILKARQAYHGGDDVWWSVKPGEYEDLKGLSVAEQVAGQVYYTDRAIMRGLESIPQENKLLLDYEDLCAEPAQAFEMIADSYRGLGHELREPRSLPRKLAQSGAGEKQDKMALELIRAYESFGK